ncbi:Autophagy-related protein 9 [Intoshia linei]|uniref:Autophagy-related protein 9 n=1 Tax=Intoshia linei TaxID=1819745 RepID=A0A177B9Z8_9BILA|nr:Autophagy-related protein 9 [Intoshia linei]
MGFICENNIQVLDWPPYSPDCNPIENLWAIMVRRLYPGTKVYHNNIELKAEIKCIWDAFDIQEIKKLVESFPSRLVEVLEATERNITKQIMFIAFIVVFFTNCINYDILFGNTTEMFHHNATISFVIYNSSQCHARMGGWSKLFITLITFICLYRILTFFFDIYKFLDIRDFYRSMLNISDVENKTWYEILRKILHLQSEMEFAVHGHGINELDVYMRILRYKNYLVGLANKKVLPDTLNIPILGTTSIWTPNLKYNMEMLLFWGPKSIFSNGWQMRNEIKSPNLRFQNAAELERQILLLALINILLMPFVFVWQCLYSFLRYAETIKREPTFIAGRNWSIYSRLHLRHFNELDHEFNARLNRAYHLSVRYMSMFKTLMFVVLFKYIAFFSGSLLSILLLLTMYDSDVLNVENIIGVMSLLAIIASVSRGAIPNEFQIFCPELTMRSILSHVSYIPQRWRGRAHDLRVKSEFSLLFQLKIFNLLAQLVSPLTTPFILLFLIRPRSLKIIDFFRNYTDNIMGVGDVCTFSKMCLKSNGDNDFHSKEVNTQNTFKANDGKLEHSLVHFSLSNPLWKSKQLEHSFIVKTRNNMKSMIYDLQVDPMDQSVLNMMKKPHDFDKNIAFNYSQNMASMRKSNTKFIGDLKALDIDYNDIDLNEEYDVDLKVDQDLMSASLNSDLSIFKPNSALSKKMPSIGFKKIEQDKLMQEKLKQDKIKLEKIEKAKELNFNVTNIDELSPGMLDIEELKSIGSSKTASKNYVTACESGDESMDSQIHFSVYNNYAIDLMSNDMCLSSLYLHNTREKNNFKTKNKKKPKDKPTEHLDDEI